MFSPSMSTSPASGHKRPIKCLSRTLLPPPLRPMMTTDSPVSTRKFTSSRMTDWPNDFFKFLTSIIKMKYLVERQGQEKVGDEDGDGGIDHCLGRRASHA